MAKKGWDTDELDDWISGFEKLEKSLPDAGEEVFRKHSGRYERMAREASFYYLMGVPNKSLDDDMWADRVADFVELIFSRASGNAMEIFYHGRTEEEEGSGPGGSKTPISYDDVLKWVKAGVEHGGKDKTILEQERKHSDGRVDEHIAFNVYEAIVQYRLGISGGKDYGPITERLERWVKHGESGGYFMELLPNLLAVWETVLGPVIEADILDEMDLEIRQAFGG